MPKSLIKSGLNLTASTTASSMTLTHSSTLSASKPQRNNCAEREQNPHYCHYNGLKLRPPIYSEWCSVSRPRVLAPFQLFDLCALLVRFQNHCGVAAID